jgi:hypothetical protein
VKFREKARRDTENKKPPTQTHTDHEIS